MRYGESLSTNVCITCGSRHGGVGSHEGGQLGAVVVGTHEEVALVLVSGVTGRRLRGRRQPLKVELVGIPFAVHFGHYILVVVVSV